MEPKDRKILRLLEKNAKFTAEEIADIVGESAEYVSKRISELESDGIIRGYKSVIDWEKIDEDRASALIEIKVTPKAGLGFEEVASRIAKYPEVESVSLVSGAYDLSVMVKGRTFHEVCNFVARELATLDSVTSTGTQFVMRRYKELDVELATEERDERDIFSL
jgi:DNA-binding Lrp family transcriptional regulator